MLKAYAVALALSTAAPVADKTQDGVKAPEQNKAPSTETTNWKPKPKSGGIVF